MNSIISICLRVIALTLVIVTGEINAEPLKFPDSFPIPMTFRAFDNLKPNSDAFNKRLNEQAPFDFIHNPGANEKAKLVKERWPDKIVTLQDAYGGISEQDFSEVWPGHLLYKAGTLLTRDISAQDEILQVKDQRLIVKKPGMVKRLSKAFPFALVIYALDDSGRPDWSQAEHVILNDIKKGKLSVKRAQWGSKPLSFKAGKAVVATHMMFWTKQWQLNFSLHSPRGGPGNLTAAEWFARKIAQRLPESKADGIEFDVGRWTWGVPEANPMDINNDLVPDYGYIDGVNSFGLGGRVFFRELRKILGPDKIIQVDSNDAMYGVRGWRYLNGAQLESFPASNDFDRFSEAFSHLRLWTEKAEVAPRFSYPFTKTTTTVFSKVRSPEGKSTDFHFRVGLAAASMVGMPHPFAGLSSTDFDPANFNVREDSKKSKEMFGVFHWDEYHAGEKKDWHWLGRPVDAAHQDFGDIDKTDLLAKADWQWTAKKGFAVKQDRAGGILSANVQSIPNGILPDQMWLGVRLGPKGKGAGLKPGKEYTLEFEARGDDSWHYAGESFDRVPRMIAIGGAITTKNEKPMSVLVDSDWRTYRISFIANSSKAATPVFGVSEQIGKTEIRNIKLYSGGAERWSREFEKGLVLLNMTNDPWRFTLPKSQYRRLKGSQAPDINTGAPVTNEVVVPPRDALYLIKGQKDS